MRLNEYDLVVIGGGHAGIEAAHAGAKMGVKTLMITMEVSAIGRMSCNPAIGGVAKGQMVRDLDAIGGLMGVLADQAGIQFRMLNSSKGPAVWGPRAQQDMDLYSELAQKTLKILPNLDLKDGELQKFTRHTNGVFELVTDTNEVFFAKTVVITSGTFLSAVMHTGESKTAGGRIGEKSANELSNYLHQNGIKTRKLKTGTPARLKASSLDYSKTEVQHGDESPWAFSFRTQAPLSNEATCWITNTSAKTHAILRSGFDRSPMFTGKIQGLGPRYCPSIEDKVNRFSEKDSHQLFLEPEGKDTGRIYVNGFSSSLPKEIQEEALRTIPGLENCEILRHGYAVEYDAIDATQLQPTLEVRTLPGLFFAGQVCGTSGYEEAAAQGLLAGINAALKVKGEAPFLIGRSESYIGVMIDDLANIPLNEPYRMFTSRAEYRLFLRHDNAEFRLMKKGVDLGLADQDVYDRYLDSRAKIEKTRSYLQSTKVTEAEVNPYLETIGSTPLPEAVRAITLVKRPFVTLDKVLEISKSPIELNAKEKLELYSEELYQGFFERQQKDIERNKKMEDARIPENFDYLSATALSIEARQKLVVIKPITLGQALKIEGVRPADISALVYYLNTGNWQKTQ